MIKPENIDVEGIILPHIPLSDKQLIDAAKKLKIKKFRGVFLRDELPRKPWLTECGIINLDDGRNGGTHWCCFIKVKNDKFYFDSYGLQPPTELVDYLKGSVYYNSERVQPDNMVCCGHLCLYVLKKLQNGMGFQDVINTLF